MLPSTSVNVQFFERILPGGRAVLMMKKWVSGQADKSVVEKFPSKQDTVDFAAELGKFRAEQVTFTPAVKPVPVEKPVLPDDEGNPFAGLAPAPEVKDEEKPAPRKRKVKAYAAVS